MASFLPALSLREFWNTRSGGLFFAKWMIFSGTQVVLSFLAGPTVSSGNTGLLYGSVLWFLPPFLPALALFGFHWRTPAWGGVTLAIFLLAAANFQQFVALPPDTFERLLGLNLLFAALAILPQVLLLIRVRRRPFLWMLAYPLEVFVSSCIAEGTLMNPIWTFLRRAPIPWQFAVMVNNCIPRIAGLALVGLVLISLMPPVHQRDP
jgi:hypothetical protein